MKHSFLRRPASPYGDKGYIALISVLIISAIVVLIATSASLVSIGESDMALQQNQAWESFYLSDFCAEYALMKLESVLNYSGNETVTIGGNSCVIRPISGSGNFNRTVETQSTFSNQTRKVKVQISQISPTMQITSWQGVSDF